MGSYHAQKEIKNIEETKYISIYTNNYFNKSLQNQEINNMKEFINLKFYKDLS